VPREVKTSLNVRLLQLRIPTQKRLPRFALGELLKDNGDRNSCAADYRLPAAHERIDFDAL
jgi:hypothetical protein